MSKYLLLALGLLFLGGCGPSQPVASNTSAPANDPVPTAMPGPPPPTTMPGPPAPSLPGSLPPSLPGPPSPVLPEPPATPTEPLPPALPPGESVKAEVGVGAKGRSLDNETGFIVEPAKTLFAFREKAVFDISIPSAMKLFEASEGRYPNSDEEFMQKIIKDNNIKLPVLPAGQIYYYDPETHDLMVRKPAK
ncbi:hypothetical protein NA78x_000176 [Anatilimnocola sp. NA78]|uniref:hypothetical protein n=1 Tax=Anatilimnocola sp. NA78 TaxID=3415683 RepID=UPI003CE4D173